MNKLAIKGHFPKSVAVTVSKNTLTVELNDGRSISIPLVWFPRLQHATPRERKKWRLIGNGHGIHWDDLDEDISVESLLAGQSSGESQASFKRWLLGRSGGKRLAESGGVEKSLRPIRRRRPAAKHLGR